VPLNDPTSRAILRLGTSLSARYTVVRLLGLGPRAVAYEGRSLDGRRVAIKVFAREVSGDPDAARELRRAIRRAGNVDHPAIVRAIDEGEAEDGAIFVVTPLLRGQTLRERADRAGGRLPVEEAIAIADNALGGLAAAHAKGLAHGALKPTNIFLTSDAEVRILDFGLGDGVPPTGPRADVCSLGGALFFVLTGRLPSEVGGAIGEKAAAVLASVAGVPPGLAEVVGRSLARDPAARWADAAAMLDAMRAARTAAFGAHATPLSALAPANAESGVRTEVSNIGHPRTPCVSSEMDVPHRQPAPSSRRKGSREMAESRIGTLLGDKYRLEELLGEGGTAAVYRAAHRNGHRVAVKVLHARIAIEPKVRDRFLREGYLVNKIGHPGVVRVSDDCVLADGTAFLVMELLSGQSLDALVERSGGVLPPAEVVRLSLQLLDVLSAAHGAGVVHRDIKPGNLFVTPDGTLRVLDFGIARAEEPEPLSHTRTGAVMGTPAFMAPEQALGQTGQVDAQTDVWAVGATMVRLLTGEYVHAAPTAEAMRVYAGSRPARSLTTIAPGIDARLGAIVDKALVSDKAARWPSAAAMRVALASLGASPLLTPSSIASDARPQPSIASDPSTEGVVAVSRRPLTSRRDHPPLRALALTGLLVGGGALLAALWRPPSATAASTGPTSTSAAVPSAPLGAVLVAPGETEGVPQNPRVESPAASARVMPAPAPTATPRARAVLAAVAPTSIAPRPSLPDRPDPCAPPYFTDSHGRRKYKAQCLPDSPIPPASPPAADPCDPPYVIDSMGRHLYKPECLH
jgi:serine/threonine protein kinase